MRGFIARRRPAAERFPRAVAEMLPPCSRFDGEIFRLLRTSPKAHFAAKCHAG